MKEPGAPKILAEYVKEMRFKQISDFLDHVQDITWYETLARVVHNLIHFDKNGLQASAFAGTIGIS